MRLSINILLYLIVFLCGVTSGVFVQQRIFARPASVCPECPSLVCPPAINLNSFDADKLNNKKGNFHLHNSISNVQIKIESKDSLIIKYLLRHAK